ncbi:MAG: hypothetical protein FWF43_02900, partial [Propionibacteriaceae bacterium]|nr:hypothetical protein [Propionibacteriaceae bacterium]
RDPNNNNRPSTFTLNTKVQKDEIVTLVAGNGRIAVKNAEAAVVGVADEGEPVRLGSHNASFFSGRVYAFVIEVPESYNPATQVTTPRKVQFDGVPAWNPATRTYGMYDRVSQEFFGNSSHNGSMFVGTITGPNGSGAPQKNPDEPPFAVTFTGTNGMGEKVSVPCADPKVVTSGHGTCVVPPSMFGGDGAGVAEVTVTWQGATGATHTVSNLTYTYRPNPPTVTSLVPSVGPMTGGGGCTVTGTHFVTLLDALGLPNQVITTGGPPGSRPAAWTEHDKTVYGWFNPETQALSKYDDVAGAMFGIVSGVETHVPATLLTFGAQAGGDRVNAAGVTVRSGLVLTCDAIPAHAPGPVDVSVTINGVVAGTLVGKYKYTLVGDLEVVKKAWLCPADVSTSNIGPDDCTAILDGGNVTAGTVVTWTYTTTFVAKNALGNRVSIGGHVLTNVTVHDDQIGDVCTHPQMLANKPYVCSAAGPILLR